MADRLTLCNISMLAASWRAKIGLRNINIIYVDKNIFEHQIFTPYKATKAYLYGRSLSGIAVSNPAGGGGDVCLLWVLCVVR